MKYSMFVGKWQPFHEGHRWLIEERLKLKKNILIGIREIENPSYSPDEVKMQVSKLYPNEVKDGKIKFIEIADKKKEALNNNNFILRGCSLRNTGCMYGVVSYTGHLSKIMLNSVNSSRHSRVPREG